MPMAIAKICFSRIKAAQKIPLYLGGTALKKKKTIKIKIKSNFNV